MPVALFLWAALGIACAAASALAAEGSAVPPAALSSNAAPAGAASFVPALRVKVTAVNRTVLASQLSGRVEHIAVRDGEAFVKGQILVQLDCAAPQAQLRRAQASAGKQQAVYATTKKLESLNSRSRLELEVARAEVEQALAEVAAAKIFVERCAVAAPFAGRVAARMAQDSQFVNEGQALLEIVDPSSLELEFIAPSNWLPWFTPGSTFTVRIDETGKTYQARLLRLSGEVDAVSQSIKAYAVFLDPGPELLPGMSGEARIVPPAAGG